MTTINDDVDKFEHHRYRVEAKLIPKKGGHKDTIQLGKMLTELRVIKHYDEQIMPYYRMTCATSVVEAEAIQAAWRTGRVWITIKKMKAKRGTTSADAVEENLDDDFIKDGEFRILVCDGAPPHVPEGQQHDIARNTPSVQFVMELAPVIPLDINKTISNGAYHDVTTSELIAHIVTENAPESSPDYTFIMSPSDNLKRYESVFMPPLNFVAALRHADRVYGIYSGTMSVFLDVDKAYILSSTKATSSGKDTPMFVMLEVRGPESASPDKMGNGSAYDKETKAYRLRTAQRIKARIDGPAKRENDGENMKLVRATHDERSGSHCKNLTTDNNPPEGRKKERVAWQRYDNPLTADRLRIQSRENFTPATLIFDDFDLGALAPNLQWTLLTDADKTKPMEGQWRCRAAEILLKKAPGSEESCSVQAMVEIVPAVATDPKEQDSTRSESGVDDAPTTATANSSGAVGDAASAPSNQDGASADAGGGSASNLGAIADAPPTMPSSPRAPVAVMSGLPSAATKGINSVSSITSSLAQATNNIQPAKVQAAMQNVVHKDALLTQARSSLNEVTERIRFTSDPRLLEQLRQSKAYQIDDIIQLETSRTKSLELIELIEQLARRS